ncbi:MAG: hypothetical protein IKZ82_00330 [Clostridia bacterium]|nr:hypothetical protein [Clostridia bacterium]
MEKNERFAVIDTETNWDNALMSIGVVISDAENMRPLDAKYFVITPEFERGGMFESSLFIVERFKTIMRHELEAELTAFLTKHSVKKLFAYNARFDKGLLSELASFAWYDIMAIAAYRQFNKSIPDCDPCCKTGRLKRGYGVEAMLRMLSGDKNYFETHNAMIDALDELTIMRMLAHPLSAYDCAAIR